MLKGGWVQRAELFGDDRRSILDIRSHTSMWVRLPPHPDCPSTDSLFPCPSSAHSHSQFWTGDMEALEVGQLPSMQEAVMVVGFPTGGDNVCVTKGVVSRLDRQVYSHGRCALLTTQTDSAINR